MLIGEAIKAIARDRFHLSVKLGARCRAGNGAASGLVREHNKRQVLPL